MITHGMTFVAPSFKIHIRISTCFLYMIFMSQNFKESSTHSHQGIYILVFIWMEWLVPVLELDNVVKAITIQNCTHSNCWWNAVSACKVPTWWIRCRQLTVAITKGRHIVEHILTDIENVFIILTHGIIITLSFI